MGVEAAVDGELQDELSSRFEVSEERGNFLRDEEEVMLYLRDDLSGGSVEKDVEELLDIIVGEIAVVVRAEKGVEMVP